MHRVNYLAHVLEVWGDEHAGLSFEAAVLVEVGLGEGVFKDHVEAVEAAGQVQRVFEVVEALARVENDPHLGRYLQRGAHPVLDIGVFPFALHFDAVKTLLFGAFGRLAGVFGAHARNPIIDQHLVLQPTAEDAAQRPVYRFADEVQ